MITHLLRLFLAHSLKPFTLHSDRYGRRQIDASEFGLYVHVPFCESICDFCPYNKSLYNHDILGRYAGALVREIDIVGAEVTPGTQVGSLYFGGGSPALAREHLETIVGALRRYFTIDRNIAIELHPRDVTDEALRGLTGIGFDMVSIGVQSFNPTLLRRIGRTPAHEADRVRRAVSAGFRTIDVDLIFCLPGQTKDDLITDVHTAASLGATQISTYPFIDFSFTKLGMQHRHDTHSRRDRRRMLDAVTTAAYEAGFERASVWSFTKRGSQRYSSITRSNYVGFGVSATTLMCKRFSVNTFSIDAYCKALEAGHSPSALAMRFNDRTRSLYWLFWASYGMEIDPETHSRLFGRDVLDRFRAPLFIGRLLGVIKPHGTSWKLTERGAYWYHLVEQQYTHQYIDKTWRICGGEPWPELIRLY